MRTERQGSKARNYVGGLLNLFDWNAKSRKKLSSKAELPVKTATVVLRSHLSNLLFLKQDCFHLILVQKFKQKKRFDGNMPTTRLHMLDEDEFTAGSSVKGSSNYSCASSLTEADFYTSKAPNVVARLIGLDSLPKSSFLDPNSTPLSNCRSFASRSHYKSKSLDFSQDLEFKCESFAKGSTEKFCTEIMPPRSAKSPVRNSSLRSPNNATHLMEAAAMTIKPGPKAREKMKMAQRVRELKEKVQAVKKHPKVNLDAQSLEAGMVQWIIRWQLMRKIKGSRFRLRYELRPMYKKEHLSARKKGKGTSVLRQNNQKHNCPADSKRAPPLKPRSQGGKKVPIEEFTSSRQRNSSKPPSEDGDDKKRVRPRSSAGVVKNKRSFDGNIRSEKKRAESSPVARQLEAGSVGSTNYPSKQILLDLGGMDGQKKFLPLGQSVDDILMHTFLEGRLKVLTRKEFAQQKTKDGVWIDNLEGQPSSSLLQDGHSCSNGFVTGQKWQVKNVDMHDQRTIFGERTLLDNRLPSPVSVFDHISITESCNSSENTDSSSTRGKRCLLSFNFLISCTCNKLHQ
ncbi:sacI homology domain-containing protein / WW domain-containing protein [Striga asiatica]|uniref:SacI homology domain-containing protein / WW domain-containing protein n=1 Tax=Striga asiatica TaxID=4170 RepID=A0A5A7PFJ8_STRAF|nr:sacI homology domain-containing protein / WW domain-containing protein [Striga asiatica]